jgi:hypothetical protein
MRRLDILPESTAPEQHHTTNPTYQQPSATSNTIPATQLTFVVTFSKLAGLTTEKQTRKTSVCGYDSGRRRLEWSRTQIRTRRRAH